MYKELDFNKLREELLDVYSSFLKDPKNFKDKEKARDLYLKYDHAAFYILKEPLDNAVGYLFSIFRYGEKGHYETTEEIEQRARNIYQSLK